jgi:hypothetical protein
VTVDGEPVQPTTISLHGTPDELRAGEWWAQHGTTYLARWKE